jgi:hypothetical protein
MVMATKERETEMCREPIEGYGHAAISVLRAMRPNAQHGLDNPQRLAATRKRGSRKSAAAEMRGTGKSAKHQGFHPAAEEIPEDQQGIQKGHEAFCLGKFPILSVSPGRLPFVHLLIILPALFCWMAGGGS